MQYRIARAPSISLLESEIKFFFLSNGWELQGGVSSDGTQYIQAVVKKE
jgi:hypothetical protein